MSAPFLTIDQLDRVNLKTLAQGGLPAPYGEGEIFGALKVTQQWYLNDGPEEITSDEALQKAVDWYCTSDNEAVVRAFERFQNNELFTNTCLIVNLMHQHPEEFAAFLESQGLNDDQ